MELLCYILILNIIVLCSLSNYHLLKSFKKENKKILTINGLK